MTATECANASGPGIGFVGNGIARSGYRQRYGALRQTDARLKDILRIPNRPALCTRACKICYCTPLLVCSAIPGRKVLAPTKVMGVQKAMQICATNASSERLTSTRHRGAPACGRGPRHCRWKEPAQAVRPHKASNARRCCDALSKPPPLRSPGRWTGHGYSPSDQPRRCGQPRKPLDPGMRSGVAQPFPMPCQSWTAWVRCQTWIQYRRARLVPSRSGHA